MWFKFLGMNSKCRLIFGCIFFCKGLKWRRGGLFLFFKREIRFLHRVRFGVVFRRQVETRSF